MSRFDITLGLLASIATVFAIAVIGVGEEQRMAETTLGFEKRSVENGAVMFDQYCATCHGDNASGLVCPPLDETSGLYGRDIGEGVACRLEELGWDEDAYSYIVSVITTGRQHSTRPEQYPGNRVTATPLPAGAPTPEVTSAPLMAMPAWGQDFGGALRADQIRDISNYLADFRSALPDDPDEAKAISCPDVEVPPTDEPTPEPTATQALTPDAEETRIIGPGAPGPVGEATPP